MARPTEQPTGIGQAPWWRRFDSVVRSLERAGASPAALRAVVDPMRHARLPTLIAWGPQLRVLYNEAFAAILGTHEAMLGVPLRELWGERWPAIEPAVQRALDGQASGFDELPVVLAANWGGTQHWFRLSFTRAADDGGLLCVATETTEHFAQERRHAFELVASDRLGHLSKPGEVAAQACRLLGEHLAAARVSYVEISPGDTVRVLRDWTDGELPSLAGRQLTARDFGIRALAQLRAGRVIRINDFAKDQDGGDTGWDSDFVCVQSHSMLAVPLFRAGRLVAAVQVDGTRAHRWSDEDVALTMELAQRTASALASASAGERRRHDDNELRSTAARQSFGLELTNLLAPLTDPQAIVEAAMALLGRQLGATRVLYAEIDEDDGGTFSVRTDWTAPGVASATCERRRFDEFGAAVMEQLRHGDTVVVSDVDRDPRTSAHRAAYASVGARALVLRPLLRSGRLSSVLNVHDARPRAWRELDVQRAGDTAERTWLALDAARAQAALRDERDRARYVLDAIAEGFVLLDRDCRVTQINAQGLRLGGVTAEEAVGRNVFEVWPMLRESSVSGLCRQVTASGRPASVEYGRSSTAAPAWLEVRALPALQGGTAVFYRDIDERKHAQEQLQEADRRRSEFLAVLANELRAALAPVATAAQAMSAPVAQPPQWQRVGEDIARHVRQIGGLADALLELSHIARGQVPLQREPLDLKEVIAQAVAQTEPLRAVRGHRLEQHLPPSAVPVRADRGRLVQALANLLANAAKYTPRGGRIELQVDPDDSQVSLSVRDNGIGMTPELIACAFEPFTQAEPGASRSHEGLGIGLALVRGIVELHGGAVSAHSEGLGRGSEFVVVLPRGL